MSQKSGWALAGEVFLDLTRMLLGAGMAWVAWQAYSPEWFFFGFLAIVCAIATVKPAFLALSGVIKLIRKAGKWEGYKRKGVAPKADEMAKSADLLKKGLMK